MYRKGVKWHSVEKNSENYRSSVFSQQKLENEKNVRNNIQKIETVLNIWRMENLTFEGKITIIKTLAISKIKHLASVTVLPNSTITQLNKIHNEFICNHKRPKIIEKTLINSFD